MIKQIKVFKIFILMSMITMQTHARYQSAPLKKLYKNVNMTVDNVVSFNYKVFSARDCKKYFNSKSIIKKGYQPVQMVITNNSSHSIAISLTNFSFRCVDAQDIAHALHRDGVSRAVGFGFGALFFSPLIIPAFVQGLGASAYNLDMDLDFEKKALQSQVIPPYTTIDGVIFASREQFSKSFKVILKDIDQKESITLTSLQPQFQVVSH